MFLKQEFNLIITIVDRGFGDLVVAKAKESGAEGATMFSARGSGIHENDTFLGVSIQPEKEVIMIMVKKLDRKKVMRAILVGCKLNEEGKGLCFSLPVDEIGGVSHLMKNLAGRIKGIVRKPSAPVKKEGTKKQNTEDNKEDKKVDKTKEDTEDKIKEKKEDKSKEKDTNVTKDKEKTQQ